MHAKSLQSCPPVFPLRREELFPKVDWPGGARIEAGQKASSSSFHPKAQGIHILKRIKISCILAGRSKLNPCLKVSPSSNTWNYICHEDIYHGPSKSSRLEANRSLFLTIFPQMR